MDWLTHHIGLPVLFTLLHGVLAYFALLLPDKDLFTLFFLVPIIGASFLDCITNLVVMIAFAPRRRLPSSIRALSQVKMYTWYYRWVMTVDRAFKPYGKIAFVFLQISSLFSCQYLASVFIYIFSLPPYFLLGAEIIAYLFHSFWVTRSCFNLCTYYCPDPENGPWKPK